MSHGCKEKNLKLEIKKMDLKNITLIYKIKMNLEKKCLFVFKS